MELYQITYNEDDNAGEGRRNWEKIYNSSNSHRVLLELEKICL